MNAHLAKNLLANEAVATHKAQKAHPLPHERQGPVPMGNAHRNALAALPRTLYLDIPQALMKSGNSGHRAESTLHVFNNLAFIRGRSRLESPATLGRSRLHYHAIEQHDARLRCNNQAQKQRRNEQRRLNRRLPTRAAKTCGSLKTPAHQGPLSQDDGS